MESKTESLDAVDEKSDENLIDPLPAKLQKTINGRLKSDVILCSLIGFLVFGIHTSTVFTVLQPELNPVLWCIAVTLGFVLHYVIPQMRKQLPWLCIARPMLQAKEYGHYTVRGPAKIMWFEKVLVILLLISQIARSWYFKNCSSWWLLLQLYVYLCFIERNLIYPLLFISALTEESPKLVLKLGCTGASFLVAICGVKCLRNCYSNQSSQYLVLTFSALCFKYDTTILKESFLFDYFLIGIIYQKGHELLLKVKQMQRMFKFFLYILSCHLQIQFVVTYIAPWQITWGSAFHAFAQPFSVPHSAMLFLQAFISAILSTPLNPLLGDNYCFLKHLLQFVLFVQEVPYSLRHTYAP